MNQITKFEENLNIFFGTTLLTADEIVEHIRENVSETKDDLAAELKELFAYLNQRSR